MQKISFYLLSNRITVTTDLANSGYSTEKRQVYQRTIKLYKGVDNTIELDVRQSDERRLSLVGKTANINFYDAIKQVLFSATATPVLSKTGIMTVTIDKELIEFIDPQKLTMVITLLDGNSNETILYADTQFGLEATVDLMNGTNAISTVIDTVSTWNYDMGSKDLISEIVDFKRKINSSIDGTFTTTSTVVVTPNGLQPYAGTITVEAADDKSLAIGNTWTTIGTIVEDEYSEKTFTGAWRFLRFRYPKWVDPQTQLQSTGIVDKITINN